MIGERTLEGWQARLRTRDPGRYFSAAFLLVWLGGWAIGEAFALWIIVKGSFALLTGTPPDPGREPLSLAPAVMVGAFFLIWLSLWTVGGIAAIAELLRLLWGEDRIVVAGGRLTVISSRGPFRTVRAFERETIRRIALLAPHDHLVLELTTKRVEISALGTRSERGEVVAALRTELALAEPSEPAALRIPERWEEVVTPEGERALVPNVGVRRSQARVAAVVTMAAALVTFLMARGIVEEPAIAVPSLIAMAATIALAAGAVWLARGRWEWRIGRDRLTLRKRFGPNVRDVFEARRLMMDSASDSGGDIWHELHALGDEGVAPPAASAWRPARPKNSRSVARMMNDASSVQDLASWLSRETGITLEDRTTPEAKAADLAQLRAMLEQSGRFGRWAGKVVDRLAAHKPRSG